MELGTTYTVLLYAGPICGVVGFIITPGLTHIRPWLIERFNSDEENRTTKVLSNNYNDMSAIDLVKERVNFDDNYRFDWRQKIRRRKKELAAAMRNIEG